MSDQPRILMCPPEHYGIEYEINPWMNRRVASDPVASRRQWEALRSALEAAGAEIELLDARPGLPDLVFTANAGLIYHDLFISSRFRYGERQGETPLFDDWFASHGFRVEHTPEGDHFEGAGDALFCAETLFAGYRFRSDARSLMWLGERLGVEVLPLELVDPRYYHLDTCFCPLDPDVALYFPGAFDDYGRSVLRDRIGTLIEASPEEAVSFSCNAAVVGRTVVLNTGAPKLARALERYGFTAVPVTLTEFIKSGGSAKCLTFRLDGEEAASWKHEAAAPAASA